jgi:ATP-binding protein involved in chromosome partitioning
MSRVKKIIAVSGFKGGVGKSSVACALALALSAKGKKTGLMDMDFAGASCHTVLGAKLGPEHFFPEEIEGLRPPPVEDIRFMSLHYFNEGRAVHMRGSALSNAVIELFAVTNWGELDYLILDMPPGLGDAALDVRRFLPGCELLCVYTPSALSKTILETALAFSKESGTKVRGLVENFSSGAPEGISGFDTVAAVPADPKFESYIGHPGLLRKSPMAEILSQIKEL